jgi:5-methylcytosine-specific restriction endonuclease McrA
MNFDCLLCGKSLSTKHNLNLHTSKCIGVPSALECFKCFFVFNNRTTKMTHLKKCYAVQPPLGHYLVVKNEINIITNMVKNIYITNNDNRIYNTYNIPLVKTKEILDKPKKQIIPSTLKRLVWNKYIGQEFGEGKCQCCKLSDILQISFNCGHIISESMGGETILSNLKPICQNCNSSMGNKNMEEFMLLFK